MKLNKSYLGLLFVLLILSCKKEKEEVIKEQITYYISAGSEAYTIESPPIIYSITGTNIETISNISGPYIMEVKYPKGDNQTVTLIGNRSDAGLILQVSKSVNLLKQGDPGYAFGKGTVSISFTP